MKLLVAVQLFVIISFSSLIAQGQNTINYPFGKGVQFTSADSSFATKFSTRIQSRWEHESVLNDSMPTHAGRGYVRRARIKFDGWAFNPNIVYKMEYDVVNGVVLDAAIKWKFHKNFQLWAGQTKLPGNRERVISSQKLQFVDRSMLNGRFTLDRDAGVQLRHKWKLGNMVIKEAIAISQGEGLNQRTWSEGYDFTGRVEILPFGKFSGKGDYFASDLKREEKPKLALGVTYNLNQQAVRERGQLGDYITDNSYAKDLSSIQADMMFKVKGFSLMGEYASRSVVDGSPVLSDTAGNVYGTYFTGDAINLQAGYLFKSNWELAARYTTVTPEKEVGSSDVTQYTFGVSKFIVGHALKVQTDFSLTQQDNGDANIPNPDDVFGFRIQFEVAF